MRVCVPVHARDAVCLCLFVRGGVRFVSASLCLCVTLYVMLFVVLYVCACDALCVHVYLTLPPPAFLSQDAGAVSSVTVDPKGELSNFPLSKATLEALKQKGIAGLFPIQVRVLSLCVSLCFCLSVSLCTCM